MSTEITFNNNQNPPAASRYIYGPIIDFLLLGGGGLLFFIILLMSAPSEVIYKPIFIAWSIYLANIINHPHFAYSYQIFYKNFFNKLTSDQYEKSLRFRYFFAGIIVPIIILLIFSYTILTENIRLLGIMINVMYLSVGWHYVKQGYGMAIVDSVLKKSFYSNLEKKILLISAYSAWISSWIFLNDIAYESNIHTGTLFDIQYFVLDFPVWLTRICIYIAAFSFCACAALFLNRISSNPKNQPYNGMLSYLVSIYLWIVVIPFFPIYGLISPAFHSLQYNAIVWRYKYNWAKENTGHPRLAILNFILLGILLGLLGFFAIPIVLSNLFSLPFDTRNPVFIFLAFFWVFINVHHYFMDNVMWRKGNPDVSRFLFGAQRKRAN